MKKLRRAMLALVAVAVVAAAVVGGGSASSEQAKTLTIGWAYDGVGNMAARGLDANLLVDAFDERAVQFGPGAQHDEQGHEGRATQVLEIDDHAVEHFG